MIQGRLAWPLRKDDTQIREAFHIFMLERVWRKGNPLTLLVGMQTSTAAMENSVRFLKKTGNRTAI